jgi:hypothetical protein
MNFGSKTAANFAVNFFECPPRICANFADMDDAMWALFVIHADQDDKIVEGL